MGRKTGTTITLKGGDANDLIASMSVNGASTLEEALDGVAPGSPLGKSIKKMWNRRFGRER
ncbi:MAG: hypothetical protein ACTSRU_05430 [Candidatus Hodarchaeales archaeon]